MEKLRSLKDLYNREATITIYQKLLAEKRANMDKQSIAHIEEFIDQMKVSVRAYYRQHKADFENDRRVIHDYGIDGAIVLIPLPKNLTTEGMAREYFEENEYMDRPNSPYDCTGEIFTEWYKIIERNGRFYAYHSIGRDC